MRFKTNYNSCLVKSSENICSSSGGVQEKGKTWWNLVYHQNWWFSEFHPPLNTNVLFCRVQKISTCLSPNSGFWCCVFHTLRIFPITCPSTIQELWIQSQPLSNIQMGSKTPVWYAECEGNKSLCLKRLNIWMFVLVCSLKTLFP
jgi:hypothetical protein